MHANARSMLILEQSVVQFDSQTSFNVFADVTDTITATGANQAHVHGNKTGRWVDLQQILTAGPLGPRSPFSHAHLLWARGHLGQRQIEDSGVY